MKDFTTSNSSCRTEGIAVHPIPDSWFRCRITTFGANIFNLYDGNMSWRRQLCPAILQHAIPSLSGSCAASNCTTFLSGVRHTSRFSPTLSNPGAFNVKDMLGKALDFKGSLSENKSPADMWSDKSDNLKLPPPPDTWTGMSTNAYTA